MPGGQVVQKPECWTLNNEAFYTYEYIFNSGGGPRTVSEFLVNLVFSDLIVFLKKGAFHWNLDYLVIYMLMVCVST